MLGRDVRLLPGIGAELVQLDALGPPADEQSAAELGDGSDALVFHAHAAHSQAFARVLDRRTELDRERAPHPRAQHRHSMLAPHELHRALSRVGLDARRPPDDLAALDQVQARATQAVPASGRPTSIAVDDHQQCVGARPRRRQAQSAVGGCRAGPLPLAARPT